MLRFGPYTLDTARHGLYRDGARVHLTPKPLETLVYLVAHRGHTVEKQQLLDAIWKDTAVTEDTLVQAVHEIRRVLEDDKTDPRFLQTVPRHGYRFVADVIDTNEPVIPPAVPVGASPAPNAAPASGGQVRADRRSKWTLLFAVLVTPLAIGGLWLMRPTPRPEHGGAGAPALLEQITPEGVNAGKPAFSSTGNILYNSGGALHIRFAGSDSSIQITDRILPSGDMPVFTADGRHVVFSLPRNGEDGSRLYDLHRVASIGGPPELLIPEASGAGFSPDGKWIAYTKYLSGKPVLRISPVGHLDQHVDVRPGGFVPRWSPDGRWVAYTTGDPNATSGDLWMASVSVARDGALQVENHTRLTDEPQPMYGLTWTRDGRSIIFAGRRLGGPTQLYRVWTSGGLTALTSGPGDYACPSVSPDGTHVMFWHGTAVKSLTIADGLTATDTRTIGEDEYHLWPALSPSATHIASVVRRPTYEDHLYVTDAESGKHVALSSRPARHPTWVDDKSIAYLEDTDAGNTAVRLVNIAAAQRPIMLAEFPGHAAWVAVHPRRTAVAVVLADAEGRQRIVVRPLGGSEADGTIIAGGRYEHLRWLPDGSAMSWSGPERSSDPHSNGVWVMAPGQPAPRRLVPDGYGPVWSANGGVVYFSRIREYAGLWQYDVRVGRITQLREWAEAHHEFDIVGERLLMTREDGRGRVFAMSLGQSDVAPREPPNPPAPRY